MGGGGRAEARREVCVCACQVGCLLRGAGSERVWVGSLSLSRARALSLSLLAPERVMRLGASQSGKSRTRRL